MKTPLITTAVLAAFVTPVLADRDVDEGRHEQREHNDRYHGQRGLPRYYHNDREGRYERHHQVYEYRHPRVIAHDRYARPWRNEYRAAHEWNHFHPRYGWAASWGIGSWNMVSSVTCEAANEETGELFPVTANNAGWSDAQVNLVLDQALDECAAASGANVCVPATPACSFQ